MVMHCEEIYLDIFSIFVYFRRAIVMPRLKNDEVLTWLYLNSGRPKQGREGVAR
jgi:hypothetical protein